MFAVLFALALANAPSLVQDDEGVDFWAQITELTVKGPGFFEVTESGWVTVVAGGSVNDRFQVLNMETVLGNKTLVSLPVDEEDPDEVLVNLYGQVTVQYKRDSLGPRVEVVVNSVDEAGDAIAPRHFTLTIQADVGEATDGAEYPVPTFLLDWVSASGEVPDGGPNLQNPPGDQSCPGGTCSCTAPNGGTASACCPAGFTPKCSCSNQGSGGNCIKVKTSANVQLTP